MSRRTASKWMASWSWEKPPDGCRRTGCRFRGRRDEAASARSRAMRNATAGSGVARARARHCRPGPCHRTERSVTHGPDGQHRGTGSCRQKGQPQVPCACAAAWLLVRPWPVFNPTGDPNAPPEICQLHGPLPGMRRCLPTLRAGVRQDGRDGLRRTRKRDYTASSMSQQGLTGVGRYFARRCRGSELRCPGALQPSSMRRTARILLLCLALVSLALQGAWAGEGSCRAGAGVQHLQMDTGYHASSANAASAVQLIVPTHQHDAGAQDCQPHATCASAAIASTAATVIAFGRPAVPRAPPAAGAILFLTDAPERPPRG